MEMEAVLKLLILLFRKSKQRVRTELFSKYDLLNSKKNLKWLLYLMLIYFETVVSCLTFAVVIQVVKQLQTTIQWKMEKKLSKLL